MITVSIMALIGLEVIHYVLYVRLVTELRTRVPGAQYSRCELLGGTLYRSNIHLFRASFRAEQSAMRLCLAVEFTHWLGIIGVVVLIVVSCSL